MEITQISALIKKLSCDHERISFAGRGCFLTQIMPASISDHGTVINPPYKRLYYRSNEQSDDTLLADAYADETGISREAAGKELEDMASKFCEELDRTKTMILPGLGKMRATARNEYFFIAEADLDIFPDGKGLTPVNMKVLHQEEETPSGKKSNLMDKILEPIKVIVTESDHGPETEEDNETEAVPETDGKPEDKEQIKDESEGPEEAEEEMQGKLKNESVERKGPNTVGIIFIILGCILFLAIVAYGILYVCRDQAWVDKILYNSEERELLKYLTK